MDISGWNWGSRDISKKRELTATEKPWNGSFMENKPMINPQITRYLILRQPLGPGRWWNFNLAPSNLLVDHPTSQTWCWSSKACKNLAKSIPMLGAFNGGSQNRWFIMGNNIQNRWFGGNTISGNLHVGVWEWCTSFRIPTFLDMWKRTCGDMGSKGYTTDKPEFYPKESWGYSGVLDCYENSTIGMQWTIPPGKLT